MPFDRRPFPRPEKPSAGALMIERAKWREFLAQAVEHGQRAADGATYSRDDLWAFTRHVFSTGKTPFPLEGAAARIIAKALVEMSTALVGEAAVGARRVALGAAVQGVARALDGLMHDEATAAYRATTGRQFKDD